MNTLAKLNPFRPAVWDPFAELGSLENRLEKFFGRPFGLGNGAEKEAMTITQWSPLVDISEDDKEYIVTAELPDLKKEGRLLDWKTISNCLRQ